MGVGRDLEGICKDGRRFPVEIGLRPAQTNSGRFVVATVIDITKRKAIEERLHNHEEQLEEMVIERTRELHEAQQEKERVLDQLIQAEKMTAVGTLVSGIGHEINNPLYVLYATAERLTSENDVTRCHAYGHDILKQAKSIAATVKSLSQYAQPGNRHDLQRVDITRSVADAVHLAQSTLRGNQVDFKISGSPVPEILAKSEEVQQALFNIVRNAIQAIDGKGRIEISTLQEGDWVTVRIQDNGAGISSEHLKQVFDPFFTTKGPDEGEGLGLYVVSQIITRYQGTIDVEKTADGGTRFIIRFPITD
jgi:C4-dicarboxylate-specific signal transduction histidine kinase